MNNPQNLPWPIDAVMVVAASAGNERRERMEGIHLDTCRHCSCEVHGDTYTHRTAVNHPGRRSRPVQYFCENCVLLYAIPGNKHDWVEDHVGLAIQGIEKFPGDRWVARLVNGSTIGLIEISIGDRAEFMGEDGVRYSFHPGRFAELLIGGPATQERSA